MPSFTILPEHYAADLPRALRVIAETSDYDLSMVWRNIVRSAELRTLNTNAALTSVLPDVRIKQGPTPDYGRIAVCVHVHYTEMLEEILSLTDTIPSTFDFIATTEAVAKKAIIEEMVTGRKNVDNIIVRVVKQNRGRDMSALFITCRDLFLQDRYDLVCRLHTKKSPQNAARQGRLFKRHLFENLLNSPGYSANVLDMFYDSPWIGVAVPPIIHISRVRAKTGSTREPANNNTAVQVSRVVELLERELGRKAITELAPMQPGDVPETCADVDDLMRGAGFRPSISIEEGVRRFAAWYREYHKL